MPKFNIVRIENWPPLNAVENIEEEEIPDEDELEDVDVMTIDNDEENDNPKKPDPFCVMVEISQLKLLLRQCHFCGHTVYENMLHYNFKGGSIFANYWCNACKKRRFWKSFESPFVQVSTTATMLSGILFAKIFKFFAILNCCFPSRTTLFYTAQKIVRPMIREIYLLQQTHLIDFLIEINEPIHICVNGQYDSPRFCAYHCTVTAIKSVTKKIIGFTTVKRSEVGNKSCNAEPEATRQLIDFILSKNLNIASITSNNSTSLNKLISTNYPNIHHFLDLWHILRNMHNKYLPKFGINVIII